jgi:dihydroorotase
MKPLLIRGGRLIDPSQDLDDVMDLLIVDGKVEGSGTNIAPPEGAEILDAAGMVVAPGLVDIHVHLREPGREDAETVASGARAAVAGGFTSVCAMPNTDPVTDNQAAVGFIVKQAQAARAARVYPIGAISVGQNGEQLAEFGEMVQAGAIAVSDDGHPVQSSHLMRTALEYALSFGIPVSEHCEDPTLAKTGVMHAGVVATRLGLRGIPGAAEEVMVARNVLLGELTGGHIHLCHISTLRSVELIRWGKDRGINVTAEATPHHFSLTHEACDDYDTNAKMNPPLRTATDVLAVCEGLKDGTLDAVATDHAPHHYETKDREFDDAPFGVIGLETALGLGMTELVGRGSLTLPELINRMSTRPADIFHLPAGTLRRGTAADVVVFDPQATWVVDPAKFRSKSRNTPFSGWELSGVVHRTIVGGEVVFSG